MNKIICVVAACLLAGTAQATVITYSATLTGPNESPANASLGTGSAAVTIDDVANTMRVQVTFSGLTAGTTASHIHVINGPGDANTADTVGPVATTTPTFSGFPSGVTAGSYDQTFDLTLASTYRSGWVTDSGGTTASAESALLAGLAGGRAYLNIHTTTYPGGEIRGFLAVPEPGTLALLGLGLAGLGLSRRRRAS